MRAELPWLLLSHHELPRISRWFDTAMQYLISITEVAESHLEALTAHDRRIVEAAIIARLLHQPTVASKAIRRLRPNPLAQFELRVREFRVLYNVDEEKTEVILLLVGLKHGNKLIVGGEEFHGHRSDPPQSTPE